MRLGFGFVLIMGLACQACSGASGHLRKGDELMTAGEYEKAAEEYERASGIEPDDPEISSRVLKAREAQAQQLNQTGLSLLEIEDTLGAIRTFVEAVRLAPEGPDFRKNLKHSANLKLSECQNALQAKNYREGLASVQDLLKLLPKYEDALRCQEALGQTWAEDLHAEATLHLEKKQVGMAWIKLVKLRMLVGNIQDSAALELQAQQKLENATRLEMQLSGEFKKRTLAPSTNKLLERVRALSFEKCPLVVYSNKGKRNLNLQLGVVHEGFSNSSDTVKAEKQYQSGTRKVINPEFVTLQENIEKGAQRIQELEATLISDSKLLEEVRQAFADAGPHDDEAGLRKRLLEIEQKQKEHREELYKVQDQNIGLRSQLARTPEKLDEPVYDMFQYDVRKVTRVARLAVFAKATGEFAKNVLKTGTEIEGTAETSDETNQAYPKYGVEADPLFFPKSDQELMESAWQKVLEELGNHMGELCRQRQHEILSRAKVASAINPVEATEDFVLSLFLSPKNPPQEALDFLKVHHEIDAALELRGEDNP